MLIKKIAMAMAITLTAISVSAQVFSKSISYDKFDDVIKQSDSKTLITFTDTTVVFETKGYSPVTYRIYGRNNNGASWDIKCLANDVYGYEDYYYVVKDEDWQTFNDIVRIAVHNGDQEYFIKETDNIVLTIINRTVTTQYTGTWINSLVMIIDLYDNNKLGKNIVKQVYFYE